MRIFRHLSIKINNYFKALFSFLFTRKFFYPIHCFFYEYSLIGMGLNQSTDIYSNGEMEVLKMLLRNINEPIVFDVGANVGDYSKTINSISKQAKIYAFEPHPKNFKILLTETKDINITVMNKGLGNTEEKVFLFDYKDNDGSPRASLFKDVIEFQYNSDSVSHEVSITTIDKFIKENAIKKIHLLKIDTEGNELNVLLGAKEAIDNNIIDVIQFEFNYTNIISKVFFNDFNRLLKGFVFYRIVRNGLVKLAPYSIYNEIFMYQNIIAINIKKKEN